MHLHKNLFFLLTLSLFVGYVSAKDIQQHPKLIKGTLHNGLTYYIYPNDYPKGEAVYRLFIQSGSVNETEEQRGLAHFLEHMAFNGTTHFPGNELVKFLESKGAKFGRDLNAHTSYNETVYKLKLPANTDGMVDTTLTILADWLDGLLLEEDEIDSERGVIMSEWLSKQKPEVEVNDLLLNELMNHSLFAERKVIGDTAIIQNFEYKTLRNYYESWYQPNLAAVAVVGDVDPGRVEELIQSKFSGMKNMNRSKPVVHTIPDYTNVKANAVINKGLKKTDLTLIQLVPRSEPVRKESEYYLYLQRTVLNRLFGNRLNALSFTNDVYAKGSIGISDFLNTKGVLMASVELMPNKIEEGVSVFISQLSQIYQYGFLPEEIEKVKKASLSSKERAAKSAQPISSSLLMDEVYADFFKDYVVTTPQEEYRLTKKYIDNIDSVSIVRILHQLVKTDQTHYIFSSFEESSMADSIRLCQFIDSIQNENILPYQLKIDVPSQLLENEPEPGRIISEKKIPEINGTELILSNGIRVIYKEAVSGKNKVNVSAYKKGGLFSLDSVDYVNGVFSPGVVSLSGAGDFSRDELSYYLAGSSASVRLLIENTRTGMVAS
ncbi:pitrilysin family protein, partial [uncultured Proteiniphilum sp.]|uniref:M16 family metallopeptidase n=1 Tax=uncultured Proteiniphilum sp. TaxID=497637 RepID=UPI002613358D